jgi:hypothetical protein
VNLTSARNEISPIAEIWNKTNCLPVVDAFRSLMACPPPAVRAIFSQIQQLAFHGGFNANPR